MTTDFFIHATSQLLSCRRDTRHPGSVHLRPQVFGYPLIESTVKARVSDRTKTFIFGNTIITMGFM